MQIVIEKSLSFAEISSVSLRRKYQFIISFRFIRIYRKKKYTRTIIYRALPYPFKNFQKLQLKLNCPSLN